MADLDQDGRPELLTSTAASIGEGDRLVLLRVREDGALLAVWTGDALGGSVLVAGGGDADGDGVEELFAIEEPRGSAGTVAHLWIVQ
jgi:hypothetical protein